MTDPTTPAVAVLEVLPDTSRAERCNTSEHVAPAAQPSTRPTRSSRNQDADYTELSPKRSKKLRRLRGIKPETCKLAIGPSQQYEGGEELFLDQEVCLKALSSVTILGSVSREQKRRHPLPNTSCALRLGLRSGCTSTLRTRTVDTGDTQTTHSIMVQKMLSGDQWDVARSNGWLLLIQVLLRKGCLFEQHMDGSIGINQVMFR